jgi:hypothetical protein
MSPVVVLSAFLPVQCVRPWASIFAREAHDGCCSVLSLLLSPCLSPSERYPAEGNLKSPQAYRPHRHSEGPAAGRPVDRRVLSANGENYTAIPKASTEEFGELGGPWPTVAPTRPPAHSRKVAKVPTNWATISFSSPPPSYPWAAAYPAPLGCGPIPGHTPGRTCPDTRRRIPPAMRRNPMRAPNRRSLWAADATVKHAFNESTCLLACRHKERANGDS